MSPRLNSNVSGFLSGFPAQISEPDNNRISGIKDIGAICRVCRVLFRDRELHRKADLLECVDIQIQIAHSIGLERC